MTRSFLNKASLMVMMMMMMMMKQRDDVRTNYGVQPQSSVRWCITWGIRPNYGVEKFSTPKVRTNFGVQPQSSVRWCITWGIRPNYGVENVQPQSSYELWGSTP